MAGRLPEGLNAEERKRYRSTYVRNLRFAAREAEEQGVMLSIEPINQGDSPNYLLTTQAEAHAIREASGPVLEGYGPILPGGARPVPSHLIGEGYREASRPRGEGIPGLSFTSPRPARPRSP